MVEMEAEAGMERPTGTDLGFLDIRSGCSDFTLERCLGLISALLCKRLVGSVQVLYHQNTFKLSLNEFLPLGQWVSDLWVCF